MRIPGMTSDSSFPFLQVQLAEMEALSLNSDKSSSILLGDESDNRNAAQVNPKEIKVSLRQPWASYTMCCTYAPAHFRCSVFIQVSLLRNIILVIFQELLHRDTLWSRIWREQKNTCIWKFSSLLLVTSSELVKRDFAWKIEHLLASLQLLSESVLLEALKSALSSPIKFHKALSSHIFSSRMARTTLTPLGQTIWGNACFQHPARMALLTQTVTCVKWRTLLSTQFSLG